MKSALILTAALLGGCNALGGIHPETINAVAAAGGGCIAVESLVMGKGIMQIASADKGVIRNGEVVVAGNATCGGISIQEAPRPK